MLRHLRRFYLQLEALPRLGQLFRRLRYPMQVIIFRLHPRLREHWKQRTRDVIACPDNQYIARVPGAGRISGDAFQIMHNGIKIVAGSYNGEGMRLLLKQNGGVHEPQEERVFMEVLKHIPSQATMIELGAYWGFYSMWFHHEISKPSCYLIEPDWNHAKYGQENFSANKMKGVFVQGYAGRKSGETLEGIRIISVDDFMQEMDLEHVHLLHSDIQGGELDMLYGTEISLTQKRIDYLFISTHSDELHQRCLDFIMGKQYELIAEHNLRQSFSVDGLIVARSPNVLEPSTISIAKR